MLPNLNEIFKPSTWPQRQDYPRHRTGHPRAGGRGAARRGFRRLTHLGLIWPN
ncbi:Neuron navigator 3 [Frankliniella fusca]|uniref:Neuron navigator 3 n=1 Tax=Frankliniella fusca TaxID=407009 RepID=A0AAE1H312_9NEOP|nr:Neuron navigator 3 [Frankliniella fusca]